MKPLAFLDTGALYALADRDDADHAAVSAAYRDPERRFLTHELILVETCSLVTKRLRKSLALQLITATRNSPRIECAPLTPSLLDAGWQRCRRFADKDWDWIDCVSFELMERRNVRDALALDHHFSQAGFTLLD